MKKILALVLCLTIVLGMAAFVSAAENTTVSVNIGDYAAANGWTNSTLYDTIVMDSVVTVSATGTPVGSYGLNTGKYYDKGTNWRIYQNENPNVTVAATDATIVSVKITYKAAKTGVLTLNGANIASGTVVDVNAASISFSVGNTGTATNGQVRITDIEVVYAINTVEETTAPTEEETTAPSEEETTAPSEEETTAPSEEETTAPSEAETTAPVVKPDDSNPKDGDTISVFVALLAISAVGIAVIGKKKF